jgi:hypothetical protein
MSNNGCQIRFRFRVRTLLLMPVWFAVLWWWATWPNRTHFELTVGKCATILIVILTCIYAGSSRTLTFFANATLIYPLIFLGLLYSEWLLAWYLLGHLPSALGDNDPAQIPGDWMYPFTALAFIGHLPAGLVGICCNVIYVSKNDSSTDSIVARSLVFVCLWLGTYLIVIVDPFQVWTWWLD